MSKSLDWRSKVGQYGTNPSPAKQGGTPPKRGSTTVGKTKPEGDFMQGKGASQSCGLATYTQRRVGHGKK